MKRNRFVIVAILLITAALWAQTATTTPKADTKAAGCACCNHDMKAGAKAGDHAAMDHSAMAGKDAKDGMACSRKDAKGGCCAGMKKDANLTTTAATEKQACGKDCCGKDCCKDGKCEMAKNGKKCCANCAGMAEGK